MGSRGMGYDVEADGRNMRLWSATVDISQSGTSLTNQSEAFSSVSVSSGILDFTFANPPVEVDGVGYMLERGYQAGDTLYDIEMDYYNSTTGVLRFFLINRTTNTLANFVTSGVLHVNGTSHYRNTVV